MSQNDHFEDDDFDSDVICAVESISGIDDAEKDEALDFIQSQVDKYSESLNSEQRKTLILSCVALIGAGALLHTNEAEASISSLINRLIRDAVGPIISILESLLGDVLGMFSEFITGGAEASTAAVSTAADAQNHVKTTIENNRIQAATAPSPDICVSDELGIKSVAADALKDANREVVTKGLSNSMLVEDGYLSGQEFRRQMDRHGSSGKNIDISSILNDEGINNDEQHIAAADLLKNIAGRDKRSPRNSEINRAILSNQQAIGLQLQAEKATALTRRQIAVTPFIDALSARDNRDSDSELTILRQEVRRTYGASSEGWREKIREYADPTPLLTEINIQLSLSNNILLKQLEALQLTSMVESVHLLELLDKE